MPKELKLVETEHTPAVNFSGGNLSLTGKSMPEDAKGFYGQLIDYVNELSASEPVQMIVDLSYFNSSSSKQLLRLFFCLEDKQGQGANVMVTWKSSKDDHLIIEKGEEFKDLLEIPVEIELT